LQLKSGVWTNKNALTHCYNNSTDEGSISANEATYLGTIYATANGQTGMAFKPAAAAGGSNPTLGLYNAYNRVTYLSRNQDSTTSWTYGTSTWRASDNSSSNRVTYVDGLGQSLVSASFTQLAQGGTSISAAWGIDRDSTSATPATLGQFSFTTAGGGAVTTAFTPSIGLHYIQEVEWGSGSTPIFFGFVSPDRQCNNLDVSLPM